MTPRLDPVALHGLPGEFVRTVEPYSEADPAALLATFLATFGAYVGPSPRVLAGGIHTARLHVCITGRTAKARKGSSRHAVGQVFELVDSAWWDERVLGGFGSGESVITAAAGDDPRVLVNEQEFGRILAVAARQGSTITQLLREAWDTGKLERRLASGGEVVKGAHVCMLAHITVGELLDKLDRTDLSGGTINRLLLIAAERSKRLPVGANVPDRDLHRLADATRQAADTARRIGVMGYTPAGEQLWRVMYDHLAADDPPSPLGDAIARAEPQALRLSIIYATADGSSRIDVSHLAAAYAVWCYARDTAAAIFPSRDLTDDEQKLLRALVDAGDAGLTGEDRRAVFSRHRSARDLEAMVATLTRHGLAAEIEAPPTGGRPPRIVKATQRGADSADGAETPVSPLPPISELLPVGAVSAREANRTPSRATSRAPGNPPGAAAAAI